MDNYKWMESTQRLLLNTIKYICITIAFILLAGVLSFITSNFIQDQELIRHSKGQRTTQFVDDTFGDNVCMLIDHKNFECLGGPNTQISLTNNILQIDKIISDGQSSFIFTPNSNYKNLNKNMIQDSTELSLSFKDAIFTNDLQC